MELDQAAARDPCEQVYPTNMDRPDSPNLGTDKKVVPS
jgi:hypothetical protein